MAGSRFQRLRTAVAPAAICLHLAGCRGPQSAFDAGGPEAARIATIGLVMFGGGGLIFAAVLLLTLLAMRSRPSAGLIGSRALVVAGGLFFPVIVLTGLLLYTFGLAGSATRPGDEPALRIDVIGRMWWWEIRYPAAGVVLANEIRVPAGRPVELHVSSSDVIHSFWVPALAGKIDMIPGRVNRLRIVADDPGIFRGQCAEFCGAQHAHMAVEIVAEAPDAFAAWLERQARPAAATSGPVLARGRSLFLASGCGDCHTVRGIAADGKLGPDLTHVGSRRTIGAAILPNNVGTLAGWIADSQSIKPGNGMPSFNVFSGADLRAVAAYLASLE